MIIGQLSIYPIGEGTSLSMYVKAAARELEKFDLKLHHGPMSTAMEAESIEEIFSAVKAARDAILRMGAKRVSIHLKIDDRRDKSPA